MAVTPTFYLERNLTKIYPTICYGGMLEDVVRGITGFDDITSIKTTESKIKKFLRNLYGINTNQDTKPMRNMIDTFSVATIYLKCEEVNWNLGVKEDSYTLLLLTFFLQKIGMINITDPIFDLNDDISSRLDKSLAECLDDSATVKDAYFWALLRSGRRAKAIYAGLEVISNVALKAKAKIVSNGNFSVTECQTAFLTARVLFDKAYAEVMEYTLWESALEKAIEVFLSGYKQSPKIDAKWAPVAAAMSQLLWDIPFQHMVMLVSAKMKVNTKLRNTVSSEDCSAAMYVLDSYRESIMTLKQLNIIENMMESDVASCFSVVPISVSQSAVMSYSKVMSLRWLIRPTFKAIKFQAFSTTTPMTFNDGATILPHLTTADAEEAALNNIVSKFMAVVDPIELCDRSWNVTYRHLDPRNIIVQGATTSRWDQFLIFYVMKHVDDIVVREGKLAYVYTPKYNFHVGVTTTEQLTTTDYRDILWRCCDGSDLSPKPIEAIDAGVMKVITANRMLVTTEPVGDDTFLSADRVKAQLPGDMYKWPLLGPLLFGGCKFKKDTSYFVKHPFKTEVDQYWSELLTKSVDELFTVNENEHDNMRIQVGERLSMLVSDHFLDSLRAVEFDWFKLDFDDLSHDDHVVMLNSSVVLALQLLAFVYPSYAKSLMLFLNGNKADGSKLSSNTLASLFAKRMLTFKN